MRNSESLLPRKCAPDPGFFTSRILAESSGSSSRSVIVSCPWVRPLFDRYLPRRADLLERVAFPICQPVTLLSDSRVAVTERLTCRQIHWEPGVCRAPVTTCCTQITMGLENGCMLQTWSGRTLAPCDDLDASEQRDPSIHSVIMEMNKTSKQSIQTSGPRPWRLVWLL